VSLGSETTLTGSDATEVVPLSCCRARAAATKPGLVAFGAVGTGKGRLWPLWLTVGSAAVDAAETLAVAEAGRTEEEAATERLGLTLPVVTLAELGRVDVIWLDVPSNKGAAEEGRDRGGFMVGSLELPFIPKALLLTVPEGVMRTVEAEFGLWVALLKCGFEVRLADAL